MTACVSEALEQTVQRVLVTVDAHGQPTCAPAVLDVRGTDVLILFLLNGADWRFLDSGAVVVTDGGSQFPYPSWTLNNKQAALFDANTSTGAFSYTVSVQNTQTGQVRRLDPTIKNET